MGHSSSAYSLEEVMPMGNVMVAAIMTSCQPQKVKVASPGRASVVWQVRCTT